MLDKTNRLMPDPRFLDELFEAGAHLFPLVAHDDQSVDLRARGKRPLKKGWNRWDAQSLMRDEVEAHMRAGRNIGERLQFDDLVLDIDPRHFANGKGYSSPDESIAAAMHAWESFCAELGIDSEAVPIYLTGSGLHIRLRNPEGTAIVTRIEGRPGFEVRSNGGYIVAAGSVHAVTGRLYEPWFLNLVRLKDAPFAPEALLELLRRPVPETPAGGGELDPRILVDLLEALDPADFREHDKWFSLMCACHHATNGDGEDEFLAWSAQDPMYAHDIGVNRDRWRSLRSDKPGIATVATLFKAVMEVGRADLVAQSGWRDNDLLDALEELLEKDDG